MADRWLGWNVVWSLTIFTLRQYYRQNRHRRKDEGQDFRALQGHKIVAGCNAPGMHDVRSPTQKGSYYPELGDARPA
jgi:hypothetical protein